MLVVAIPGMQCEGVLALDHLSTDGALSVLLLQDCSTQRRGRLQRQLSIPILAIWLPVAVEWVGVALDLAVTLEFDRLLYPKDLFAGRWIRQTPCVPRLMGKVARGDPPAGFVRVAECGPPRQPSPPEAVELRKRLATDDMTVRVRPASSDGVQGSDALGRCSACGLGDRGF